MKMHVANQISENHMPLQKVVKIAHNVNVHAFQVFISLPGENIPTLYGVVLFVILL